jgi:hypothetical protein
VRVGNQEVTPVDIQKVPDESIYNILFALCQYLYDVFFEKGEILEKRAEKKMICFICEEKRHIWKKTKKWNHDLCFAMGCQESQLNNVIKRSRDVC